MNLSQEKYTLFIRYITVGCSELFKCTGFSGRIIPRRLHLWHERKGDRLGDKIVHQAIALFCSSTIWEILLTHSTDLVIGLCIKAAGETTMIRRSFKTRPAFT